MFKIRILYPREFHKALQKDLRALGLNHFYPSNWGYHGHGDWMTIWRLNLSSRVASRIILELGEFHAQNDREFYQNVYNIAWQQWIHPGLSIKVHTDAWSCFAKDTRFLSLRIKDAIVDKIRNMQGTRPSVNKTDPDVPIWCHGFKNQFIIGLDTTKEPLFKRGWRRQSGVENVHLKENLAAAIILESGWNPKSPLYDPFCGSGTLPIEAAAIGLELPPFMWRSTPFAFEKWPSHDSKSFEKLKKELWKNIPKETQTLMIFGSDLSDNALQLASYHSEIANLSHIISFFKADARRITPPTKIPGWIITNPPYNHRLKTDPKIFNSFLDNLEKEFSNWHISIILPQNFEWPQKIAFKKNTKTIKFHNGPIACYLLNFQL